VAIRQNTAEGGSTGTTVSAANSGSGSGTAFSTVTINAGATLVYATDQKHLGTTSYHLTSTAALATLEYTGVSSSSAALRFYIYLPSLPSAGTRIATFSGTSAGVGVNISGTGRLQLVDNTGAAISTFTNILSTNTWYRVEMTATAATTSTGSAALTYYANNSTTPAETAISGSTYNLGTGTFSYTHIGKDSVSGNAEMYLDDIAFDDSSATPIGPASTALSVALRSAGAATHASNVSTLIINKPAVIQEGDYLIAFLHNQSSASATDWTPPSGWTKIGPAFTATTSSQRVTSMFGKFAGSSEPSTYSFGSSDATTRVLGVIHAYSGVDTTTPVAASSGFTGTTSGAQTINVPAFAGAANLYTIEMSAGQYTSPSSYALSSNTSGLTLHSEVYRASGATQNPPSEDTTVSRSAMRVWGGMAGSSGISAHSITTTGSFAQMCAALISLNVATVAQPTATPTVIGHTTGISSGSSGTISINPATNLVGSAVAADDWVLAIFTSSAITSDTKIPTPPSGWTNIVPLQNPGTGAFNFGVWAHKHVAGETIYTWTQTTTPVQNTVHRLVFVRGADDIAQWITGTIGTRVASGGTTTTTAASITTTSNHTLGLLLAGERTTAGETENQITCNNFTKQWFDSIGYDHTLFVATKDMIAPSATGSVTVTYPNPQAQNGIALQLGIPGIASSGEPTTTPQRIGYVALDTNNTAVGSITLDPSTPTGGGAIANDDWMIAFVAVNDNNVITPPSGWTAINNSWGVIGTYRTKVYARKRTSGDTTYTFTSSGSSHMNAAMLWIRNAHSVANWVIGTPKKRTDSPTETTTITAPSITTTAANSLALSFGFERTLADESSVGWTGASQWFFTPQHGSSIVTFAVGYEHLVATAATGDTVISYANSQTDNGWGYQVAIPVAPASVGLPLKVSDGSALVDAHFQLADGAGGFIEPGAYKVVRPGYASVTQMLAQPFFYCAHRGGSREFPEMSMYAYGQSALLGYPALEFSVGRTSDGVFFGLHDSTLDRTSGVSGVSPGSLTWAQVQSSYEILGSMAANNPSQPNRPYMRFEDLMSMYYGTHVILVDPKYLTAGQRSDLLDLMDTYPNSTDHFVGKYYGVSGGAANTSGQAKEWADRGYQRWGYFYETDSANFATYAGRWTILGMDYNASQTAWDDLAAAAPTTPIMGHICPNLTAVNTAVTKGAVGAMVSGVKLVTVSPDYL
jgi:hypothetical protein